MRACIAHELVTHNSRANEPMNQRKNKIQCSRIHAWLATSIRCQQSQHIRIRRWFITFRIDDKQTRRPKLYSIFNFQFFGSTIKYSTRLNECSYFVREIWHPFARRSCNGTAESESTTSHLRMSFTKYVSRDVFSVCVLRPYMCEIAREMWTLNTIHNGGGKYRIYRLIWGFKAKNNG